MDLIKQKKHEEEILKVIKEKKIAFFDHCFAYTTFSRANAYIYQLDKLDTIKDSINQNRVSAKNYMLNKWIASDNPTLQISAMRLLSDSEEHKKLNQNYTDHTTDGNQIQPTTIIFTDDINDAAK
jgi:hypothetical protein